MRANSPLSGQIYPNFLNSNGIFLSSNGKRKACSDDHIATKSPAKRLKSSKISAVEDLEKDKPLTSSSSDEEYLAISAENHSPTESDLFVEEHLLNASSSEFSSVEIFSLGESDWDSHFHISETSQGIVDDIVIPVNEISESISEFTSSANEMSADISKFPSYISETSEDAFDPKLYDPIEEYSDSNPEITHFSKATFFKATTSSETEKSDYSDYSVEQRFLK